ncbi:MAG TPA: hypothetical protein VIH21_10210 [Dehalococcoidia bacterium]|jgi:lauroyl/myristoyl acyltransferase
MGGLKHVAEVALAWVHYLYERWVLLPVARVLPKRIAYVVADIAGLIDAMIPAKAGRAAHAEARAFGGQRLGAFVFAARRLAGPRRDLVDLARLRRLRDDPSRWRYVETGREAVDELRAQGRAILVVSGHFRTAIDTAARVTLAPESINKGIRNPVPAATMSPYALRERLQNTTAYGLSQLLIGETDRQLYPIVGRENMQDRLLEELSRPGGWARIQIDAIWDKPGAYERPFAGAVKRKFALGAARIARLAQAPVVPFMVVENPAGICQVVWGTPLEPPPIDDKAADVAFMDLLLDGLERDVGRYPLEYLHPIGGERRWNAACERWESI